MTRVPPNDMIMTFHVELWRSYDANERESGQPVPPRSEAFVPREGRRRFGNGSKRAHDPRQARVTLIYFSAHDRALDREPVSSRRSLLCRRRLHALLNRSAKRAPGNGSAFDCAISSSRRNLVPPRNVINTGNRDKRKQSKSRAKKEEHSYVNRRAILVYIEQWMPSNSQDPICSFGKRTLPRTYSF